MQNTLENSFRKSLNDIIKHFSITGAVLSNISQISMLPPKMPKVANFTFHIFNGYTIFELEKLGFTSYTASYELNQKELSLLLSNAYLNSEILVYGRVPLMTMQYCLINHCNHCIKNCSKACKQSYYELKDRLGLHFKIEIDPIQTITTIYNSKINSIAYSSLQCDSVRISFLEESEHERKKNDYKHHPFW